jgi:hypothetical protein
LLRRQEAFDHDNEFLKYISFDQKMIKILQKYGRIQMIEINQRRFSKIIIVNQGVEVKKISLD